MTKEEQFVNELIGYIFAYPDDDYMTMECLCRKLHKHELIAKVDGHWQPLDKRCEDCIFVEGSHWCDGCDKTPKGMKEYDEYWAKADRKTESNSGKPNNCELQTIRCPKCGRTDYIRDMEKDMGIKGSHYKYKCINCNTYIKDEPTISKMEQVDKDINVRSKDCETCKWGEWYRKGYDITMMSDECGGCCSWNSKWTPKDEPQTDTEIAKAIVHKMIDDSVIAEDAYPDLRQKLHDAVDEYEPQTDFLTFLYNVINPNEMEEYRAMYEAKGIATKDEPQTDCAWK